MYQGRASSDTEYEAPFYPVLSKIDPGKMTDSSLLSSFELQAKTDSSWDQLWERIRLIGGI